MDSVVKIFTDLGANISLVYQFIIFVITFVLSKVLFSNHLQDVLETRTENTTTLEESADDMFNEIDDLNKKYKNSISAALKESKASLDAKKIAISKKYESSYKDYEKKISLEVESARNSAIKEIEEQKAILLGQTSELADELVSKVTKG